MKVAFPLIFVRHFQAVMRFSTLRSSLCKHLKPKHMRTIQFLSALSILFISATVQLPAQSLENWAAKSGSAVSTQEPAYPSETLIHQELSREVNQAIVAPLKSIFESRFFQRGAVKIALVASILLLAYALFSLFRNVQAKSMPITTAGSRQGAVAQRAA